MKSEISKYESVENMLMEDKMKYDKWIKITENEEKQTIENKETAIYEF